MIVTDFDLQWALVSKHLSPMIIGGNTFASHCESIIMFSTKVDNSIVNSFYHANGELTGKGVTLIAGHKSYSILAFAENCLKPNIYIILYPSFTRIQTLPGSNVLRYIAMCFSDSEYLIALTGYPSYMLKIWNYRSGHLLVEKATEIESDNQYLSCGSGFNAFFISQYAPILKTVYIWEVHPSDENAFLIRRRITIPFLKRNFKMNLCFGIDGLLYCVDKIGNLYTVQQGTGMAKETWLWNGKNGTNQTNICVYRGGFVIHGSSHECKFIKKVQNSWSVQWTIEMDKSLVWLCPVNNNEKIYALSSNSTQYYLMDTKDETHFVQLGETKSVVIFVDFINPFSTHLAIVTDNDSIKVIDVKTMVQVVDVQEFSNITAFRSHPEIPYSVIGDQFGTVYFLSFFDLISPKIVIKIKLGSHKIINNIMFSSNFLTVQDEKNDFYSILLITERPFYEMFLRTAVPDYYIWASAALDLAKTLILFFLVSENMSKEPTEILVIKILKSKRTVTQSIINLEEKYTCICVTRNGILIAIPSRGLALQVKQFNDSVTAIDKTILKRNLHQVGPINIRSNFHVMSWGPDGIICIYDADLRLEKFLLGHGRGLTEDTIQGVRVARNKRFCLTLSKRGVLKCFQQTDFYDMSLKIPDAKNFFGSESLSTTVPETSWLEQTALAELQRDISIATYARNQILNDFQIIQEKVQLLIDENEKQNRLATLEMHFFNLDKEWWSQKLIEGRKLQELENQTLMAYLNDQLRITEWIKRGTWALMNIKGCRVRGIFIHSICDNFPLPFLDSRKIAAQLNFIAMRREQENQLAIEDGFHPWIWNVPVPKIESVDSLNSIKSKEETFLEGSIVENLSLPQVDLTNYQLSGSSTYQHIKPLQSRYEQIELVFFNQLHNEVILGQYDIHKLKEFFNNLFIEMQKVKKLQVEDVNRKNGRLRHIQSERNIMLKLKGENPSLDDDIVDPIFLDDENPERIVTVDPSEISVLPYISPSRQKLLDDIAYAAELRRLALLADDFRDRALMAMMDGVLEKLWEDEIKKDVPLPDCFLNNKDPFNYTKEDHIAIKDYEEKVEFLKSERRRYEKILEDEKLKIENNQDEQILKFNAKCEALIQLKYQIDLSIKEEDFRLLMNSLYNFKRKNMKADCLKLKSQINENKIKIIEIQKAISTIEKIVSDCKGKFEMAQSKDRLLERQFKLQFSESAPPFLVDLAYKIFKRRPKWPQRAWGTPAVFIELSHRIGHKDISRHGIPLPDECYDFLTAVEAFDHFALAPNTIDSKLWETLCKMRRHKMESEFKLKGKGAQLAEAEATLSNFTKELNFKKSGILERDKNFQATIQKYNDYTQNRYIQLVLPMGQVEIDLTGSASDFDKCILLSSKDVDDINNIIKKAGRKKLNAMHRVAMFRRKVIFKEWEHKVLQMSVQDLKDFLWVIEHSKITFDILQVLRQKMEKRLPDLSTNKLNRDIEHQLTYLQKSITEINAAITATRTKIDEVKKSNAALDSDIQSLNVAVTNQNINRDVLLEELEVRQQKERMNIIFERGKLMRQVQAGHAHIMELATLLELQRLRTFPTLSAAKPCPV